jgi:hypothetical protein
MQAFFVHIVLFLRHNDIRYKPCTNIIITIKLRRNFHFFANFFHVYINILIHINKLIRSNFYNRLLGSLAISNQCLRCTRI